MFTRFLHTWSALKTGRPGHRFENRYNAAQRTRTAKAPWEGPLVVASGIALIAVGAFLLVVPGPGLPVIFVGAALLAGKSRRVAVALDWTELKVRHLGSAARRVWHKASLLLKITIIAVAVLSSATAMMAAYAWFLH